MCVFLIAENEFIWWIYLYRLMVFQQHLVVCGIHVFYPITCAPLPLFLYCSSLFLFRWRFFDLFWRFLCASLRVFGFLWRSCCSPLGSPCRSFPSTHLIFYSPPTLSSPFQQKIHFQNNPASGGFIIRMQVFHASQRYNYMAIPFEVKPWHKICLKAYISTNMINQIALCWRNYSISGLVALRLSTKT